MKKTLTEKEIEARIEGYFQSRRTVLKNENGEVITSKTGEVQYLEKPPTITGLALALGFCRREDLFLVREPKKKALIDRALLRIEESAEEKLFHKETYNGTRLFLATNFSRWRENAAEAEGETDLGVCSVWAK